MPDPRLDPPYSRPTYAVRAPLVRWLATEAKAAHAAYGPYRVLDVGCGEKPYEVLFEGLASEYVGVDPVENPRAELRGAVESLPIDDARFEVVLCSQVLEHCNDPAAAIAELARVTAPGGRVLLSTHGVMVYHPSPADYWRWTHAGLERLFDQSHAWSSVTVTPASGTAACLAMLGSIYLDIVGTRLRLRRPLGALVAAANWSAERVDRRFPRLSGAGPGTLIANYHVAAIKART
jgi:SAM-dependent methyltransferase